MIGGRRDRGDAFDRVGANLRMAARIEESVRTRGIFELWFRRYHSRPGVIGAGEWRVYDHDVFGNKTPDVSLQYQLDAAVTGGAAISSWFIGLINGPSAPTYAAGDTMASHAGWTENAAYSEATRQAWTAARTANNESNSASKAVFTINAGSQNLIGAFVVSNSTKSGSTGTLFAEGSFTQGNRTPLSGDQIVCQYDYALASTN